MSIWFILSDTLFYTYFEKTNTNSLNNEEPGALENHIIWKCRKSHEFDRKTVVFISSFFS